MLEIWYKSTEGQLDSPNVNMKPEWQVLVGGGVNIETLDPVLIR